MRSAQGRATDTQADMQSTITTDRPTATPPRRYNTGGIFLGYPVRPVPVKLRLAESWKLRLGNRSHAARGCCRLLNGFAPPSHFQSNPRAHHPPTNRSVTGTDPVNPGFETLSKLSQGLSLATWIFKQLLMFYKTLKAETRLANASNLRLTTRSFPESNGRTIGSSLTSPFHTGPCFTGRRTAPHPRGA